MNLIDRIAETIYRNSGGMTDDEYLQENGHPRREWQTDAPWDSNPDELCEWERDDYRMQAKAVMQLLQDLDIIKENEPNETRDLFNYYESKRIRNH